MLSSNVTINASTVSADTALGQVAAGGETTLRTVMSSDNSRAIRKGPPIGELIITTSPSKEITVGGQRSLLRMNLAANGTALPGASAYLVVTTGRGTIGANRGIEAVSYLLQAVLKLALIEEGEITDLHSVEVDSDAIVMPTMSLTTGLDSTYSDHRVGAALERLLARIIAGEG